MYELEKKIGKVFTSKFVGTGPSSYEKRIYRAAVSQRLRNTGLRLNWSVCCKIPSAVDAFRYMGLNRYVQRLTNDRRRFIRAVLPGTGKVKSA